MAASEGTFSEQVINTIELSAALHQFLHVLKRLPRCNQVGRTDRRAFSSWSSTVRQSKTDLLLGVSSQSQRLEGRYERPIATKVSLDGPDSSPATSLEQFFMLPENLVQELLF